MENKLIDKATLKNIVYRAYNTHEHKDGNWVSFEDHEQALTEAKKEAVRELVEKLEKQKVCCETCSLWHSKICDANKDCVLAITEGAIKKVGWL